MHKQTTARVTGLLFLTATAAGVLSAVLLGPLDNWYSSQSIADNAHRITAGAIMVLVMTLAIAMIPPTLFPVLNKHGEAPALGYVAARIIEVVLLLPAAIGPLMMVSISTTQSDAGTPDNAVHLDTVRILTQTYDRWGHASSLFFFCLGALLLNYLLYRSRLVPRWIAGWALVAVVPYLADAFLVMFGLLAPSSAFHAILVSPLALNEMVLAVWLLVKGFSEVARTPRPT
ncbi:DUF4386 domain-containing protein [Nonomuraea basaltis]|uniref:DUF4386 domain-containing protein n=1 Tax=Nonomuraea basaltis TaxID=2495887 RepID=UPI00110C4EF4|nr:DUF4386 domain-containing protein [Nonomuraea basaltis]TMR94768.1 DUF4386 domain-containing protein [Nonomuraea basaltis]